MTGIILRPSSVSSGDNGALVFKDTIRGDELKVGGSFVQPCAPSLSFSEERPVWQFPTYSLAVLHTLQWDEAIEALR